MLSQSKNREPIWYVLLGAAIATGLVMSYYSLTTEQNEVTHGLGLRNEDLVSPNCVIPNETNNSPNTAKTFEDLLPLLKNASMDDNTIIFTEVNDAHASPGSMLDLFLESFHVGDDIEHLLDHLIIIAMDRVSFERCKSVHHHCYLFKMDGENFESEKTFMSEGFINLVWTKIKLMQRMLEFGYNVIYTDLDVMWLRNILRLISIYYDIILSNDGYNGWPDDVERHSPNTGLFYMKSTVKNAEVLNYWYEARKRFPRINEQRVFNFIKKELLDKFQIKMQLIETDYLSGFCRYGRDLNKVYTMHSNCCVGLGNKTSDLRGILDDWKKYKALPVEEKNKRKVTWTVPRFCIH